VTARLSAILWIYKALGAYCGDRVAPVWMTRANARPIFKGARLADVAIEAGLSSRIEIRDDLDARAMGN